MSTDTIDYRRDVPLSLDQFIELYERSTLAERRPAKNRNVMRQMMENASLTISAWAGEELVGISRTLTDFGYAAYLSDLAVSEAHQNLGIGKRLIEETREALGPQCMLILLSAPRANEFYRHIGFSHHPRAWVLESGQSLTSTPKDS